jgi:hypothetical protein
MVYKHAFVLAVALAALPLAVQPDPAGGGVLALAVARAQQMGNDPWNYSRGNRGFWANYQAVKKSQDDALAAGGGSGGGSGGGGSGTEVYQYYSVTNSTAIANQNIVTQTLGDGATGYIGNHVGQDSMGNQTAHATSDTTSNPVTNNTFVATPH